MRKITRIGLLLLVIVVTACGQNTEVKDGLQNHLESGNEYLQQGHFNAAIIEAKAALQFDESNEKANILLAKTYLELGQLGAALGQLATIKGKSDAYNQLLVDTYIERGKFGSALHLMNQHPAAFPTTVAATFERRGDARLGLQDIQKAEEAFNAALKISPNSQTAHIGLIRILAMRGDLETAEEALEKLIKTKPGDAELLTLRGAIYVRQGRLEDAESALTDALFALPTTDIITRQRANLLRNMIQLLAYQGRSGEALVYQKALAESFPNSQEVGQTMTEALQKIDSGDFSSALDLLNQIEKIAPNNEITGTLRGVIAYLKGDNAMAQDFFLENIDTELASNKTLKMFASNQFSLSQPYKVVQILGDKVKTSTDPDVLSLFGMAALSADREEEGLKALRKAIDLAPDRSRLSIILARYLRDKDPKGALETLQQAYARNPNSQDVWLALVAEYNRQGKVEQSLAFAEGLRKSHGKDPATYLVSGSAFAHALKIKQAIEAYEYCLKIAPKNLNARFGIALVNLQEGNLDKSEQMYREIIDIDHESSNAYRGLLGVYLRKDEQKEGIANLSKLSHDLEASAPLAVIANFLASIGDTEHTEAYLDQAREFGDNLYWKRANANIYFNRALEQLRGGQYADARSSVFTALSSYPANKDLLGLLVEIEVADGSLGEAQKVIDQMAQFHPASRVLYVATAELAFAEKDWAVARQNYELALAVRFDDRSAEKCFETIVHQGDESAADAFLKQWRVMMPESAIAGINQAEQLIKKQDVAGAIALYEQLRVDFPNSLSVMNNLAWQYIGVNQVKRAVEVAKLAYERSKQNPNVADTYGWALFKNGESKLAVTILERAYEASGNAEIGKHLEAAKGAL